MAESQAPDTIEKLRGEIEELRSRLSETEETLNAIRNGEVDAIVVSGDNGEKVFSLASAETPYRIILEDINEGVATFSSDGVVLYCNQAFANLLSVTLERILGSKCVKFLPDNEKAKFESLLRKSLKGNVNGDISLKTKKNQVIHLNLSFKTLPDEMEESICLIATNITERKKYQEHLENNIKKATNTIELKNKELRSDLEKIRIEKEKVLEGLQRLQESENRYRAFFDNSIDAILITHLDGSIEAANQAACDMFGMTEQELLNSERSAVVDLSDPRLKTVQEESERTGRFRGEHNFKRKDGSIFPVDDSTVVYTNLDGKQKTIKIIHDITERKKAEKELKGTHQKLNMALENGNTGTWEWNMGTNEVIWDERTEKIFGRKPGTFDKTFNDFENNVHEEDVPHVRDAIIKAIERNHPLITVFRTRSQKSELKYVTVRALVIKNQDGKPISMSGVIFDVTGMQKETEQTLFKINEELLRSNKDLQQFAYVASHDLQEPLRMVSSFTQLLEQRYKDKLDEDGKEFIKYAVDGSKRMYDLLNALLLYSRVQTKGKNFVEVKMNDVLEKVIRNLILKVKETNAVISFKELPIVFADENQMIQLFQNLVENSMKFSSDKPYISISSKSENEHYIFSVMDKGMGIEPQYFDRIFQIFQRLNPKEEFEGTGIGLAICKRIVERHSGKIWIESVAGKGSTFYFTIPKEPASYQHHPKITSPGS